MLPRLLCEQLCSLNPGQHSVNQSINQTHQSSCPYAHQGIQLIESSCISHMEWWSELDAGQSLVVV